MVFRRIYTLIKEFIMLKVRDAMKRFILAFGAVCLILTSVLMFAQTAARYIFHYSFYWSDELARYAIIWGAQLCAAVGVSERTHTALDFLASKLPSIVHSIVNLLLDVLYMFFFCCPVLLQLLQYQPGYEVRICRTGSAYGICICGINGEYGLYDNIPAVQYS